MKFYREKVFPWILDLTDPPGMDEQRGLALRDGAGDVLEIGLGTGLSLRHYPDSVRTLTAVEPTGGMQKRAVRRATEAARTLEVHRLAGEELPFEDGRFDAVVSILVLCSVDDVPAVLAQAYRVLRPGGLFLFLEHVVSSEPRIRAWQHRLNSVNKVLGCGCELIRDTEGAIRSSRFAVENLERATLPGLNAIYPLIRGFSRKPV